MKYSLACGDVMPGCGARFEAPDQGALFGQVARHAAAEHGITDITPEIAAAVEARIVVSG
jgi:predicted small metal-binding protein